jgi:hypothetical protein
VSGRSKANTQIGGDPDRGPAVDARALHQ